ncbi:MAG: hypothetical protein PW792_16160 [Acidobacteriaceae bacterium]|nr:hypothetical protein [Acidobacteriaceae bacterium]
MRQKLRSFVLLLPATVLPFSAAAQMHHVDKPEDVTRAVSVYEWTGPLDKPKAVRLVPVTVFINDELEDGGTYLSRPVPFALAAGNLYSVEKAGDAEGTLELKNARKLTTAGPGDVETGAGSWYGYGDFHPPAPEKLKKLKPSKLPARIDSSADDDDSEPHFVTKRPAQADDSDKPTMNRRAHPTSNDADDPERPTLARRAESVDDDKKKKEKKQKPQGYVTGYGNLNDDPDRPTLSHGKKASDEPDMLTGLPADMHQAVAVSDPGNRPQHIFTRGWSSSVEREQTLDAMRALAAERVKAYLAANALVPAKATATPTLLTEETAVPVASSDDSGAPPKLQRTPQGVDTATHKAALATSPAAAPKTPTKSKAGKAKSSHKAQAAPVVTLTFANEELHAFNLSYGGLPTFVYTASAPVAMAKDGTVVTARVAIVAQRLPEGNVQVSLAQVTDSAHLNRAPWMRFIDVVDADGSHRASLLFERRANTSRDFALYRLVTAKAESSFSTAPLE